MTLSALERQRLFGTDLRLDEMSQGLDVRVDAAGDIARASGSDNIVQALTVRLKVRRGELAPLGWPNFGSRLHELIGEPNNDRTRTISMAHARAAILEDPRVAEITKVEARSLPGERDVVRIELELRLIEDPVPLNLVIDQALGIS